MSAETIAALLAERRQADAHRIAIVDDANSLPYGDLDARSAALAAELIGRGVNKGQRM